MHKEFSQAVYSKTCSSIWSTASGDNGEVCFKKHSQSKLKCWVDIAWEMWHCHIWITRQKEFCWNVEQRRGLWIPHGYKQRVHTDHKINSEEIVVYSNQPYYTTETKWGAGFCTLLPTRSNRHSPTGSAAHRLTVPVPPYSIDVKESLKVTTTTYISLLLWSYRLSNNANATQKKVQVFSAGTT